MRQVKDLGSIMNDDVNFGDHGFSWPGRKIRISNLKSGAALSDCSSTYDDEVSRQFVPFFVPSFRPAFSTLLLITHATVRCLLRWQFPRLLTAHYGAFGHVQRERGAMYGSN